MQLKNEFHLLAIILNRLCLSPKIIWLIFLFSNFALAFTKGLPSQNRNFVPTDLPHQTGVASSGGAWVASPGVHSPGYLTYGPYVSDIPTGNQNAIFTLSIGNNTMNNDLVAELDVVSGSTVLGQKSIYRKDFSQALKAQIFSIPFYNYGYTNLEFRIYWNGVARITHHLTTISQIPNSPNAGNENWHLMMDDQFSGYSLKRSIWYPCYAWAEDYGFSGCTNNQELQWYQPDDVLVDNGILHLRAQKRHIVGGYTTPTDYEYTSGLISSHDRFEFLYGYAEVRMKLPSGKGMFPAFWMLTRNSPRFEEIDIENLGNAPNELYLSYGYGPYDGVRGGTLRKYTGVDFSRDYHTYGIKWEPDALTILIDGVERYRTTEALPNHPMYLILNLAVGGSWAGPPNSRTVFPNSLDVDYVKVWQH